MWSSLVRVGSPARAAAVAVSAGLSYGTAWNDAASVDKARGAIVSLIDASAEERGDGSSVGPTFVRLAWHSSGTYCKAKRDGGSDGGKMKHEPECSWGANAGLAKARSLIEKVAVDCGLSRADAYTLSGVVAVEEMGGPKVAWREGRSDSTDGKTSPPDGRLPDADKGELKATVQHLRDIFHRMGFDDRAIVALSGAHALGRCHTDASGYWGPWTYAETTFSNEYFRLLLEERWTLKTTHEGKPWKGPTQFESADGKLMMLPSDMALLWDAEFRKCVEEYAKDEDKFFADFSTYFSKLLELGCSFPNAETTGLLTKLLKLLGLA